MESPYLWGTDYGRPMKPFFIEIQTFWAWADKFWGIWGIFGQTISTHFFFRFLTGCYKQQQGKTTISKGCNAKAKTA